MVATHLESPAVEQPASSRLSILAFRRKSFYTRSVGYLAMVIIVMLAGSLAYQLSLIHAEFSAIRSNDAAAVAQMVARGVALSLRDRDEGAIDAVLRAAAKTTSIGEIRVASELGDYVRRIQRDGQSFVIDGHAGAATGRGDLLHPIMLDEDGTRLGMVRVVVSNQTQRNLYGRLALDSLVACIIMLGLGLLLLNRHLQPAAKSLDDLTRYAREMDAGSTPPVPIAGSGIYELDELGRTLSSAAHCIGAQAEELRCSRARLQLAIDTMEDGFALFDNQSRLVLCNQRFLELSPEQARSLCAPGALFEDIQGAVALGSAGVDYAGADLQDWLAWRVSNCGTTRTCEIHLSDDRWIRGVDRAIPQGGFVVIRSDITDLKRARLSADAASRAKSEFLANMSHEIRTPLAGIIGMADVMLDSDIADDQREYVSLSRKSAVHMLDIVNDILDFSKIEAGGMQMDSVSFSLGEALDDTLSFQRLRAEAKGLEFNVIKSAAIDRNLIGDPGRLRQILVNLLGNAIKFTESGSVTLRIHVVERNAENARIRFVVTDTGVGIPIESQALLFKPFTQADASTQRRFGGSGLGLAICARLAELMGGCIWFDSTPGQGSMFVLEIGFSLGERVLPSTQGVAMKDLCVMVVDDNDINRLVVMRILGKRGHRVIESDNVREGLELVQECRPDVILMDLQMPEIDGFEALKRLRSMNAEVARTPVIALTAHALSGDRERCIAAGFDGYVSKPIELELLLGEIGCVVARGFASRAAACVAGPLPPARFSRALAGLDGDAELFAEIAAMAATQFVASAGRLDRLCEERNMAGLEAEAHRNKGNWAQYSSAADESLPQLLEAAASSGNAQEAVKLGVQMAAALRETAAVLLGWLAMRNPGSVDAQTGNGRINAPAVAD